MKRCVLKTARKERKDTPPGLDEQINADLISPVEQPPERKNKKKKTLLLLHFHHGVFFSCLFFLGCFFVLPRPPPAVSHVPGLNSWRPLAVLNQWTAAWCCSQSQCGRSTNRGVGGRSDVRAKLILALALARGLFEWDGGVDGKYHISMPSRCVDSSPFLFPVGWGWWALSGQRAPFLIMCVSPTPPKTQLEVFFTPLICC